MTSAQIALVFLLILAATLAFSLAGLAWRRRWANGMRFFLLLMVASGYWALTYILELILPGLEAKLFWANMEYIAIVAIPVLWMLYAYEFTGENRMRTNSFWLLVLFVLPLITLILVWTNPAHGLMRSSVYLANNGAFGEVSKTYGPWFWVNLCYDYLVMLVGTVLFVRGTLLSGQIFRSQRLALISAALLPWVGNFLYVTGIFQGFDLSPVAFSLAGAIFVWSILRLRLLDLLPVARDSVLESLEEGVVVLDEKGRVVDVNQAGCAILSYPRASMVGQPAGQFFAFWPSLRALVEAPDATGFFQEELHGAWYELRLEPVHDPQERNLGRMVVLRDVTALRLAETRLRLLNDELEQIVAQRTNELSEELENRRRAEAALQVSEERYALAARGANDGLWDWDVRSGSVYYSARWSEIFGLETGEMVGSLEEWLSRVHPDDAARVRREIETHLRGETADFRSEHRIRLSHGIDRWVLARGQAVLGFNRQAVRIAGSITDISAQKAVEEQLLHNALHDSLTGLPNRALFFDRLGQAIARLRRNPETYQFAVLYLDFDRFKLINDSLGHNIGDLLLIASARRLAAAVRGLDTVARLGGDEFVVLLDDVRSLSDAVYVTERIQSDLGLPFDLEGFHVFNSASVGIVLSQKEYERPEEVLRDADIAMYHAKQLGRARYTIFDTQMRQRAHQRLEIETDLRMALERDELRLHYQPLVELESGRLIGFEALLRWFQPLRGLVEPMEFIPVAEETGLILPIGHWVLEQACAQMQAWRGRYPDADSLHVSVNISARQLSQADFAREVEDVLEKTSLPATALQLEITETALLEENEVVAAALSRLREMGIRLYLDDFGTGYSSLTYLHRYQVDALKIDPSFVTQIGPQSNAADIVRSILTLGNELHLEVIAEGVETPDQLTALQSLSCHYGQGYWFSRAVAPEQAEEAIQRFCANQSV